MNFESKFRDFSRLLDKEIICSEIIFLLAVCVVTCLGLIGGYIPPDKSEAEVHVLMILTL